MIMELNTKIQEFLLRHSVEKFLEYVKVWTTSDEDSTSFPSTPNQFDLGKLLVNELKEIGLTNITHDEFGYVYGDLPASKGYESIKPIGLIAHLDTSYAVSGKNVEPIIHKSYDGGEISLPKDKDLIIHIKDAPELEDYIGMDLITASGDTLLGADDKAGIAEIITACAAWQEFPELIHGPIMICFTPDEETGRGTQKINKSRLPEICYTMDGSKMGELEFECFDAWLATFKFKGLSVHTGKAKDKMINSINIASRYFSSVPEFETPEHTEDREGFFHLYYLNGNAEESSAKMLIRDHEEINNERRINLLKSLKEYFEERYPGVKIELELTHQYKNMLRYIEKDKRVIEIAAKAIEEAGLEVISNPIRGGTDGARLSEMGIPTPNIFSGGLLFHSKKEFIPTVALQKASEVIINLGYLWTKT
jgi:tripeptide aminopeptidase